MRRRDLFTVFVILITQGCAGASVATVLRDVITGIEDAGIVVSEIESFVAAYFRSHVNDALQAKFQAALSDVKVALDLVVRLAQGAKDISDTRLQAAIADFAAAFAALAQLGQAIGIQVGSSTAATSTARPPGTLSVNAPLLFLKVKK